MSRKTISSIYHFEKNYIQIPKLNCVLKIYFNNDELTHPPPSPGPTKSRCSMRSKQNGALELTVRAEYSLCSHTEKLR